MAEQGTLGLDVVVTSLASDAHTWNLVYLQLTLEEMGHRVTNLGACVPDDRLVAECVMSHPDLVVISSVNGHGYHDGLRVITKLRARPEIAGIPIVIGGRLGIFGPDSPQSTKTLLTAGFDGVFDGHSAMAAFRSFLVRVPVGIKL